MPSYHIPFTRSFYVSFVVCSFLCMTAFPLLCWTADATPHAWLHTPFIKHTSYTPHTLNVWTWACAVLLTAHTFSTQCCTSLLNSTVHSTRPSNGSIIFDVFFFIYRRRVLLIFHQLVAWPTHSHISPRVLILMWVIHTYNAGRCSAKWCAERHVVCSTI